MSIKQWGVYLYRLIITMARLNKPHFTVVGCVKTLEWAHITVQRSSACLLLFTRETFVIQDRLYKLVLYLYVINHRNFLSYFLSSAVCLYVCLWYLSILTTPFELLLFFYYFLRFLCKLEDHLFKKDKGCSSVILFAHKLTGQRL